MDTTRRDTSIAHANALHRMLLQGLLSTRIKTLPPCDAAAYEAPTVEAVETLPMLYRSEAFAEDLLEPQALGT